MFSQLARYSVAMTMAAATVFACASCSDDPTPDDGDTATTDGATGDGAIGDAVVDDGSAAEDSAKTSTDIATHDGKTADAATDESCLVAGTACTHKDRCVLTATCKDGACEPLKKRQCDDGRACTADTCDPATGACLFDAAKDGTACEDGTECTVQDTCKAGVCTAGVALCICSKYADCAPFEDGNACTGRLYCELSSKSCRVNVGTIVTCVPWPHPCTKSVCNPATGSCKTAKEAAKTACEDGDPCTYKESCDGDGKCEAGANVCACTKSADCEQLDDGNACNGTLFCDKSEPPFVCRTNLTTVVKCPAAKDQCKRQACLSKTGKCAAVPLQDGTICDDGDACTTGDVCAKGSCTAGTDTCVCQTDADCALKEDGDLCNGTLFCNKVSHSCELNPKTVVTCQTVGDTACLVNTCSKLTGLCAPKPRKDGTPCSDGSACTPNESCKSGACVATTNTCECTKNKDCAAKEDGDVCNGTLFCDTKTNKCLVNPATVISCATTNDTVCAKATCVKLSGACTLTAIHEGKACDADSSSCTKDDHCAAGVCAAGTNTCECKTDAECANKGDGDACKGALYCDKSTNKCAVNPATKVLCKTVADTACLVSECQPKTGKCAKVEANQGGGCDDGNPCTKGDGCLGGACKPGKSVCECSKDSDCAAKPTNKCAGPLVCDKSGPHALCKPSSNNIVACAADKDTECARNRCDEADGKCKMKPVREGKACKPGTLCAAISTCNDGACKPGPKRNCDDANPCTTDACKLDVGCTHAKLNAAGCDDGNKCTKDDVCVAGFCNGTAVGCNDANICTKDECAPLVGCKNTPVSVNAVCDDGNVCTVADSCKTGVCSSGGDKSCDDGNQCTQDVCDPKAVKTGGCTHTKTSAACDDGNLCTAGDSCNKGVCLPGQATSCDDNNDCTKDGCQAKVGCTHAFSKAGATCDDGDKCTLGDVCVAANAGGGKGGGSATTCKAKPRACDDDNACTVDGCDAKTGVCTFTNASNGGKCGEGGAICFHGNCVRAGSGEVNIPAGTFAMGCDPKVDKGCDADEQPQRIVTLSSYWIDRTEVTVSSYKACIDAGVCPPMFTGQGCRASNPNTSLKANNAQLPVNCVSHGGAQAFCGWTGKRLPTEAEWEKAARGGCTTTASKSASGDTACGKAARIYPWGSAPPACTKAHIGGAPCGKNAPVAVGSVPAGRSVYGLDDMAGNVWEWVADWYSDKYYIGGATKDPKGPASGSQRVARGGAYLNAGGGGRTANRIAVTPTKFSSGVGFRCARDASACDDGNPCTDDSLDAATGKCSHTAVAKKTCDDGNPCTADKCDASAGGCTHAPVAGKKTCGKAGTCKFGACIGSQDDRAVVADGFLAMGCAKNQPACSSNAMPQHLVQVATFFIDRREVTVASYKACVAAKACAPVNVSAYYCGYKMDGANNTTYPGRSNHPMNCVSWTQASAYCKWAGGRLPTEAEWEKATRGGCEKHGGECTKATPHYAWGNENPTCKLAVMREGAKDGCGTRRTWKVGSRPAGASPYGLLDAAGNVLEWVADYYDAGYYAKSPEKNPKGPTTGYKRTIRGGGYSSLASQLTGYYRYSATVTDARPQWGFRCAYGL